MTFRTRPVGALLVAMLAVQGCGGALPPAPAPLGPELENMPLYPTLGPHSRAVTTNSDSAQAYFTQGLQLMYSFTPSDAALSFRIAQRHDPTCAMCFWGEAWALGPYLNGAMRGVDARRATAAVQKARALAGRGSGVERALIDAMSVRYEEEHDDARRRVLDQAYADRMAQAFGDYPSDLEIGTLYGEALMLLQPRRGNWDIEDPGIVQIHQVLESVLDRDIEHPGACHLYIHATESTTAPEKAEACAEFLGNAIPGASHINHMPSHTYNRVGRWGDAVRANIQAWHSDQRAEYGEGFAIYPSHNVHMLLFAASMDGQGAVAEQAGRDYGKIVEGGQFYRTLALVRFGRFDEILDLHDRPENPIFGGFWDFGRGYAHLRLGQPDSTRVYLQRLKRAARDTDEDVGFRGHSAADLLGIVSGILEAELAASEGLLERATILLEQSVFLEDRLRYDEPEPLNFSARHYLGAVLLESGQPIAAERVYRDALEDHPRNGWSLFGLEQSLRAQGRLDEARSVHAEFVSSWARADTWIRSSRF